MEENLSNLISSNAMSEPQYFTFSHSYLKDFTTQVFMHFGVPEKDARTSFRGIIKSRP